MILFKFSMLLTVFQMFLAWMIGAWQCNKVLPPAVLVWRDVTVAEGTVIGCWFWLGSWNHYSYNDQHTASMSADCVQSVRAELQWTSMHMNTVILPKQFLTFQRPPWAAWPLNMMALWSFKTSGFTRLMTQCHILEQWYSTWGTRTPGGTWRHLGGGYVKLKKNKYIISW
jgi:hypothetical protein